MRAFLDDAARAARRLLRGREPRAGEPVEAPAPAKPPAPAPALSGSLWAHGDHDGPPRRGSLWSH